MRVGQKITWESQSGGSWTKKSGKIIAEIPSGENALDYVPDTVKKSHIKFESTSTRDRVLVAVPAGKDGNITHYYCPNKGVLNLLGD